MMRLNISFIDQLERIKPLPTPERGYAFERFIEDVFKKEHFSVTHNSPVAKPRQVDLFATRHNESYLIEAKWKKRPSDVGDIDSLFTRLEEGVSSVVGLLVSFCGFTQTAIERVKDKRSSHPIILLNGQELEKIIRNDSNLAQVLQQKKSMLRDHNEVFFLETTDPYPSKSQSNKKGELPTSSEIIVSPNGIEPKNLISSDGGFDGFIFVREIPDIDWVPSSGYGVCLDFDIPGFQEQDLINLLHQLNNLGWTSKNSQWSIQQITKSWHGSGTKGLVDALKDWENRYRDLKTHHTEEICYFDVCEGGLYSLIAQIAAYKPRMLYRMSLSFQLSGIPINSDALRHLSEKLQISEPLYFRPRDQRFVEYHHSIPKNTTLDVVDLIIEEDELEPMVEYKKWVTGIVVKNPYYRQSQSKVQIPDGWPQLVSNSELLICKLRSWHPLNNRKSTYRLCNFEIAWTSNMMLFSPVADWDDEKPQSRPIPNNHALPENS